ncbi:OmpA family protein [Mesobaculum littorinae]|uniref:OmpA family protein n=1 Tax=Mesobaculum littorinae TaxID=2486419 RepID=A0A438AIF4_9RHOB|nr:OmpA family protein [Mesobaculum littorinae]RVV98516.1 OmpA family protein [Mesobaculum littorinae]
MRGRLTALALAGATIAACTPEGARDFNTAAGASIDSGTFGNATMNNHQVQTGQTDILVSLNTRFSTEVDPTVTFPFDSAVLDATARATLARQASWIRQFPEVRFRVYGHTDLVGPDAYNRALGLRRAQAAVAFLTAQGISRSRLEAVVSYGETQPLIVTQGRERRNRRTVTEVVGFVSGHPMLLNGKYAQVIFREYVDSAVPAPRTEESGLAAIAAAGGGG